jgi:hypothetical protein
MLNQVQPLTAPELATTLKVMDRVDVWEQRAGREQEGPALSWDVPKTWESRPSQVVQVSATPPPRRGWKSWPLRVDGPNVTLVLGFTVIAAWGLHARTWTHSNPAAVRAATVVAKVRDLSLLATAEVQQRFVHPTNNEDRFWAAAIQAKGEVQVVDHVGRPEIIWSHVSAETCAVLAADVKKDPEQHVALVMDGHAAPVSCEGPAHVIQLEPTL